MKKQKVKKDIKELLDNISEKEVLKLRECSCDKNSFDSRKERLLWSNTANC